MPLVSSGPFKVLERRRLLEVVENFGGTVLISAPIGSGKSILADQLRQHLPDRRVVDDATDQDLAERAVNDILLRRSPFDPDHRPGESVLELTDWSIWFTVAEVEELLALGDSSLATVPAVALSLHGSTKGWPAATGAVADLLAQRPKARRRIERASTRGPHLDRCVSQTLALLDDESRRYLGQIAHLGYLLEAFFDDEVPITGIDRLRQIGFPVWADVDGLIYFPEPVRLQLASREPLDLDNAVRFGTVLTDEVGIDLALQALLSASAFDAAVEVVERTPERDLAIADATGLTTAIARLMAEIEHPLLNLILARLFELQARLGEGLQVAQAGLAHARSVEDGYLELRLHAIIARLHDHAGRSQSTDDVELLEKLQAQVGDYRSELELQELHVYRLCRTWNVDDQAQAILLGQETARGFASLGLPDRAASLLRKVALTPALRNGRYELMQTLERQAQELTGEAEASPRSVAFRCLAAALAGDLETYSRVSELANKISFEGQPPWLFSYVWFSRMAFNAYKNQAEGVRYAYHRFVETIGELRTTPTGFFLECFAASFFSIAGMKPEAEQLLKALGERRNDNPMEFEIARFVVRARSGEATDLDDRRCELLKSDLVPLERRWRIDLEYLLALGHISQAEDDSEVASLLEEASRYNADALASVLLRQFRSETAEESGSLPSDRSRIQVFSEFAVHGPDGSTVARGKAADLLKLLAVRGGRLRVEAVVDALWPDLDLEQGRRRLKNVVSRARTLLGPEMIERRGDVLALNPLVGTDIAEFRNACLAADGSEPGSREYVEAACLAISLAGSGLLPNDVDVDWIDSERWNTQSICFGLLDRLLQTTDEEPACEWLMEMGIKLDVLDENYFFGVARRSAGQRLGLVARRAMQRAREICDELDIPFEPSPDMAIYA